MKSTMSPWSRSEQRRRAKRAVVASESKKKITPPLQNYEFFTEISRWVGDGVTLKSTYYGWWEFIALGPLLLM